MFDSENDDEFKKIQRKKLILVIILFAYIFTSAGLFLIDTIVFDGAGVDQLTLGIIIGVLVLFPIIGIIVTRLNRNPKSMTPKPTKKILIIEVGLIIFLTILLVVANLT